jgi:hypothetical protein
MRIILDGNNFKEAEPPFGDSGSCFLGEEIIPKVGDYVSRHNVVSYTGNDEWKYNVELESFELKLWGYSDSGYYVMPLDFPTVSWERMAKLRIFIADFLDKKIGFGELKKEISKIEWR